MTPRPRSTWLDLGWLMLVLAVSSAWAMLQANQIGATFDEPFYVAKGLEKWRTGSNRELLRVGTMPLPVDVRTLPLLLWERLRGQDFEAYADLPTLLPVARAMTLPFWWLLLTSAWRLARRWGGEWAGRFAVGLVGFEPNLLAHAGLATTDIAVTAVVLLAVELFAAGRGQAWGRRVLLPGVAAGLAVACKASAITFVPLAFAVVCLPELRNNWRGQLRDLMGIGLIATVALFAYCGSDWKPQASFVSWARDQDGSWQWLAENLRIFPNAGEGLVSQVKHNVRGHGCYVLGEWHDRAVWYYFPVVLSAKLSEPTLLLTVVVLTFRLRQMANPAALISVVLLLFSLTCRVQIGVRLMFPFVAFLHVALAVALAVAVLKDGKAKPLAVVVLLAILMLSASTFPNGLRQMNWLWGGPPRSAEVLADSNDDWGQGLPELRRWCERHDQPRIAVWYYGADPAVFREPFDLVQVNEMPAPGVEELRRRVGGKYLAVGTSHFTACPDRRPETLAVIDWLNRQTPVATVGTFRVYDLTDVDSPTHP